jgi:ribose transport system permease protein
MLTIDPRERSSSGRAAVNAALILFLRLHSLVVTIGMAAFLNGATLMITSQPAGAVPD